MKIAVIGAGGARTPLLVQSIQARQSSLGLDELSLMDPDTDHLELIGALIKPTGKDDGLSFRISFTANLEEALDSADYVITTFRVGGMAGRVVDERVPLSIGVLGQETTGAGGFAMGMRSIPVLLGIIEKMHQVCPNAWLINFSNPAGMMAEAALRVAGWQRTVGICDGPASIRFIAAMILGASYDEVHLDYFGLNHLGWVKSVQYHGKDHLPGFLALIQQAGGISELPFAPEFVTGLGMIPNEYLFYYYYQKQAIQNILKKGQTRGEQILALNEELFEALKQSYQQGNHASMRQTYHGYLERRQQTYLKNEIEGSKISITRNGFFMTTTDQGYAGVALDLIEALHGGKPISLILNILNQGAVQAMADDDVVEIPAWVTQDSIQPMVVGKIPDHCLGLMKQVKEYERLTIAAVVEGSYIKARQALTLHPLVGDYLLADVILKEYMERHGELFPRLK